MSNTHVSHDTASLQVLAEAALDAAKAAGADSADVLVSDERGVSMEIRGGSLERAERAEGRRIGLRVLVGQGQACVATGEIGGNAALTEMAERAVAMAREAPEDPYVGLAEPEEIAKVWDAASLDLEDRETNLSSADLADAAKRAEAAALSQPGISQVSDASASAHNSAAWLAATNGFSGGYGRSYFALSCVAIAGEGLEMERDYAFDMRSHHSDLDGAEAIGSLAAERALARAGAQKPPTGAFPVLFDERISGSLIGHVLSGISGSSVARGVSWLKGSMGEQVLPPHVSLYSDPLRPRVRASQPFDVEGLPARKVAFVEDGALRSWVLDLGTARQLGLSSTGHAARGTGSAPGPSAGNITMKSEGQSRDALIRDMGEGLLITSLIGATVNPNTGDYSRGASGFWVRGGEICEPVNECTIAGNLKDMLKTMIPADDERAHLSRPIPSILVEGLTIAGA